MEMACEELVSMFTVDVSSESGTELVLHLMAETEIVGIVVRPLSMMGDHQDDDHGMGDMDAPSDG